MIHKFFPILLFVVELGVVYGVTTVVSAHISTDSVELTVPLPVEEREVRIEVVSNSLSGTASLKESIDEQEIDAELPAEVRSVELDSPAVKEQQDKVDYSATVLLATLMDEEEVTEESSEIQIQAREVVQDIPMVPFYSQFADISSPTWQKVGCGIASLAMLIDFYADEVESVDMLLNRGIAANAYLNNAGWIHAGLINLSKAYGLSGESVSLAHLSTDGAFSEFKKVLADGPVMASVHYTFEPTNPIPHLVVITGVADGKVFYNDPAEASGGGSLSIEKFQRAWKKRYIEIRPV